MSINVIDNFLSDVTYDICNKTSLNLLYSPTNTFFTNGTWDDYIIKDSFPVLIHRINRESDLFKILKKEIEHQSGYYLNDQNDIMFYYWTKLSYIPWHNDGTHDAGLTIYLNDEWDRDNGGIFLYKDKFNEIRGILPEKNKGVLLSGGLFHTTTPVHCSSAVRRTVQVFLTRKENLKRSK